MGAEPDEAKHTPFQAPAALNGVIGAPGDEDRYIFPAKKGQAFEARVFARNLGSPLDAVIHLVKQGGAYLIGNDDSTYNGVATPDSAARFSIPEDGDYILLVHDQLRKGGPEYFYRIEVVPLAPRHLISPQLERASQAAQSGAIAIAVPKGNRQALLVNSSWVDSGGDVIIGAEGLPPGVTMEADTQPASHGNLLLMFTAAPDAAPSGALVSLRGKHADPAKTLPAPSEVSAVTELVTAPINNISFWGRTVDRLAVAVTDEAPFSIEIVEPKVPIVRNGSMGLKVVAHRKEGFKAPIAIALPWNPPGITSAGGVVIAEGQNEAVIPLNADGAAELRTARIAVNGTAGVINGPMMVSSPLAKLTVAAPFVNLTLQAGSVEQGKETDLAVKVDRAPDFPADAPTIATILGLPTKVVSEPKPITKETQDLVFHIKTDPTSPAGNHTTLMCQVVITLAGEPIVHNFGGGQLRIDAPLPPKPNAPPAAPAVAGRPRRAGPGRRGASQAAHPAGEAPPGASGTGQGRGRGGRPRGGGTPGGGACPGAGRRPSRGASGSGAGRRTRGGAPGGPEMMRLHPSHERREVTMRTPRHARLPLAALLAGLALAGPARGEGAALAKVELAPPQINLTTARDRQSIVVQATFADGLTRDVTAESTITVADGTKVRRDGNIFYPVADGATTLAVAFGGQTLTVPVTVARAAEQTPISFRLDVMPTFLRAGCNTGSCHGSARGRDGFRLSLFGFDPAGDYLRITREQPGRRVNLALPAESTLLEKAIGAVPHTGGQKYIKDGELYQTVKSWIEAGTPDDDVTKLPTVMGVELYPPSAVLDGTGSKQAFTVRAKYSDGTDRDVTSLAMFLSNNDVSAAVTPDGVVTAGARGEAFVMARFETFTVGSQVLVLPKGLSFEYPAEPEGNDIDKLVAAKLKKLRIAPSALCTDENFLRRATSTSSAWSPRPTNTTGS